MVFHTLKLTDPTNKDGWSFGPSTYKVFGLLTVVFHTNFQRFTRSLHPIVLLPPSRVRQLSHFNFEFLRQGAAANRHKKRGAKFKFRFSTFKLEWTKIQPWRVFGGTVTGSFLSPSLFDSWYGLTASVFDASRFFHENYVFNRIKCDGTFLQRKLLIAASSQTCTILIALVTKPHFSTIIPNSFFSTACIIRINARHFSKHLLSTNRPQQLRSKQPRSGTRARAGCVWTKSYLELTHLEPHKRPLSR